MNTLMLDTMRLCGNQYTVIDVTFGILAILLLTAWISYGLKRPMPEVPEETPVEHSKPVRIMPPSYTMACEIDAREEELEGYNPPILWVSKYAFLRGAFVSGFKTVYILASTVQNYTDTLEYLGLRPLAAFKGGLQYRWLHPDLDEHLTNLKKHGGVVVFGYGASRVSSCVQARLEPVLKSSVKSDMPYIHRVKYLMSGKQAGDPRKLPERSRRVS